MILETPRCLIRRFTADDAPDLYEILSDSDVMKYIEPPFTRDQTSEFIENIGLCDPPLVYALIWKETEHLIGHVIFHQYKEDSYEIGWIISKEYWGQGIASEVTVSLIEYAKKLKISSCIIECDQKQTTSIRIAHKHGFLYVGKDDNCEVYRLRL
ncbi:MAG: GNAT family N-acetyltransferase [Oscillospiraceae bacterium]|nr:GNAT family N-acetyltransferase [Oscillospiraceae bacterium]